MSTYNVYENARRINGSCLHCNADMFAEGPIHDDIQLCHACYDNDTLIRYGYFTEEEILKMP